MARRASIGAAALTVAGLIGTAPCSAEPIAHPAVPSRPSAIVYVDGDNAWTMHSDGGAVHRLTTKFHSLAEPAWSPHGRRIAFHGYGICTTTADGSHLRRLTKDVQDYDPSWSPNGRRIVFDRRGSRGSAIYRIDARGGGLRRLTRWSNTSYAPAWSPIGNKIAYYSENEPGGGLHVMKPDGSDKTLVSASAVNYFDLDWSDDGQELAFSGGNGTNSIYIVAADGSHLKRITSGPRDGDPVWSPDGKQLMFDRTGPRGNVAIFRKDVAGEPLARLTPWRAEAREPAWRGTAAAS